MARQNKMTMYIVHVSFRSSQRPARYEELNAEMTDRGFLIELKGSKGTYELPPGAYWCQTRMTPADVRLMARAATRALGEACGILVIRSFGWSASGLKRLPSASEGCV